MVAKLFLLYRNSTFCAGRLLNCHLVSNDHLHSSNLLIDTLTNVQFLYK